MTKYKVIHLLCSVCVALNTFAQNVPVYDPAGQPGEIQYFKPQSDKQFVGDCIPFSHEGKFYLFWLLDEGHHSSLNGLGAHQWCVSTSTDLVHWDHHPIAIGIDEDWEKSICTGSVASDGKKFYAFYATRLIAEDGSVNERLSYAISRDGITFKKHKPNPFYSSAPGYSKRDFRDAKVVIDEEGKFHLFVSSRKDNYVMDDGQGCLVHLVSGNLNDWSVEPPLIEGVRHVPECPDYFYWNGWYYLIYGQGGDTYYQKSRYPYGPWEYPSSQALVEKWVNVAKTASFGQGRRIVAGWIPSRDGNKDNGCELFGGNVVLREAIQLPNGDLATKWPEEVVPHSGQKLDLKPVSHENCKIISGDGLSIAAKGAIGSGSYAGIPQNCRISMNIQPVGNCEEYGIVLRSSDMKADGYRLHFNPNNREVTLSDTSIEAVDGLNDPFCLEIIMRGDIIDVCINGNRCLVNRLCEKSGDGLWLYAREGEMIFKDITIRPLK